MNNLHESTEKSSHSIKIDNFEGPIDLLCHLIEKNKINIYDIPIVSITDQYLDFIRNMKILNLEVTSEFILMASTLLNIKSRMLLPSKNSLDGGVEEDPREELVLKILEYRRCKLIANDLKLLHSEYSDCSFRLPELPQNLGINPIINNEKLFFGDFLDACKSVEERNRLRFSDISKKIFHILRRDRISVLDKMKYLWRSMNFGMRYFFNELFPKDKISKEEIIAGFLALLELLKTNKIKVSQAYSFDVIEIEKSEKDYDEEDTNIDFSFRNIRDEEQIYS